MTIYLATAAGWCFFVAILPYCFLGDGSGPSEYVRTTLLRSWDMWTFAPKTCLTFFIVISCGLAISYALLRTHVEKSRTALLSRLYVLTFLFGVLALSASLLIAGLHNVMLAGILLVA